MSLAAELQILSPTLRIWSAYESDMKAEVFSTAIQLEDRLYLVDPIPLAPGALAELTAEASISGIFITNANHARAANAFAAPSGAALLASPGTASALWPTEIVAMEGGARVGEGIEMIAIAGAAEGEIALYLEADNGTLIVGDALINFGSSGFSLLPAKYCQDRQLLRNSLRQLLEFRFERLLFAHGKPIMAGARGKLEVLLGRTGSL
jgi:glyoxylase-like metal-dependent hydrolase (beta-lactamase superfamily II)